MCFNVGITFCNSKALSMYDWETNITDGKQSERIDCNSYFVSFISKGTVINPEITDAKTHAPYSGLDSDRIANFSSRFKPKSLIK